MISDEEIRAMRERDDLSEVLAYCQGLSEKERYSFYWKLGLGKVYAIDATASYEALQQELATAIEQGAEGVHFLGTPPMQIFAQAYQLQLRLGVSCRP